MSRTKRETEQAKRATRLMEAFTKELFLSKADSFLQEVDAYIAEYRHDDYTIAWKERVKTFLCHALGDDAAQVKDFENVSYMPPIFSTGTPQAYFDQCYNDGLKSARRILKGIADEVREYFSEVEKVEQRVPDAAPAMLQNSREVFIVHGHDEVMIYKVKDFLRTLDLTPIILREQPNGGRTIMEKFEKVASATDFAIVLLTADDVGRSKKETELKNRARQNVVFELGYFTGKFGRGRIAALCDRGVETPGDIAGVVYTPIDEAGAWRLSIGVELRNAGYRIDLNKIVPIK